MLEIATDLHGHTFHSDGRASPEAFVAFRREIGMRAIAVSDHDVFSAIPRAAKAATEAGMYFVPAMEVTAFLYFGTSLAEQVHVLAYFPPRFASQPLLQSTELYRRGARVQEKWKTFVLDWLDEVPADDRRAIDPGDELARVAPQDFPALQSMIDRVVAVRRERFEEFRARHVRFWEADKELFGWTPEEAIDCIRGDGALDVVAHPGRYRDKERTKSILHRASGVEVYTSRHKAEVAEVFKEFATANRKFWTASSDDHQNARYMRPPRGTPVATMERILGRALPVDVLMQAGI